DDLADDAGALRMLAVRRQAHLVHAVQDAALDRLEAVADVWQRPVDDDGHRVVDETALDLVRDLDRDDFSFVHQGLLARAWPAPGGSPGTCRMTARGPT